MSQKQDQSQGVKGREAERADSLNRSLRSESEPGTGQPASLPEPFSDPVPLDPPPTQPAPAGDPLPGDAAPRPLTPTASR